MPEVDAQIVRRQIRLLVRVQRDGVYVVRVGVREYPSGGKQYGYVHHHRHHYHQHRHYHHHPSLHASRCWNQTSSQNKRF